MAFDRSEAIGLASAVGGHGILLAIIALGLFGMEETIEKPQSLAVTLEGDGTPLPVTGEVGAGEIAPALVEEAEEEVEAAAESADSAAEAAAQAEADAKKAADAAARANATAAEKRAAREAAAKAAAAKRARDKAARDKARKEKAARDKAARDKAARDKAQNEFDELGKKFGGSGKTSAQEKRSITASINGAVKRPWDACRIPGATTEIRSLKTVVKFTLTKSGGLGRITSVRTSGRSAGNAGQIPRFEACARNAISRAAPFKLPAENYSFWQNSTLTFTKK